MMATLRLALVRAALLLADSPHLSATLFHGVHGSFCAAHRASEQRAGNRRRVSVRVRTAFLRSPTILSALLAACLLAGPLALRIALRQRASATQRSH
jgi:hypothetical protein